MGIDLEAPIFGSLPPLAQSLPAALLALLVCFITAYRHATSWRITPEELVWITDVVPTDAKKPSMLSFLDWLPLPKMVKHIRGHLRDASEGVDLVYPGYEKYSKKNTPYIAPSFTDWHGEVVLPPSQFGWLGSQSDEVLSFVKAFARITQFPYTTPKSYEFSKPFHAEAISKVRIESCIAEIQEEIEASIDRQWGTDTESWKTISLNTTLKKALIQTDARVFYGEALARDEKFINNVIGYISNIGLCAFKVSIIPEILKPVLARFITRQLHMYYDACVGAIAPTVRNIIEAEDFQPRTLLETLSKIAVKSENPIDRDPENISSRCLAAHDIAVSTSTHAVVNTILDITSTEGQADGALEAITKEAQTLSSTLSNSKWTRSAVAQLVILDSAIRDSMRLNPFKAKLLTRIVNKEEGITLPSGHYLPYGTKVGVPTMAVHEDEELYKNATRFDAFRFCRQDSSETSAVTRKEGMVNPSETFMSFGLGRHACPGRHLASNQLKIMLAYIVRKYEMRGFPEERPDNWCISDHFMAPPIEIEVRRKKE